MTGSCYMSSQPSKYKETWNKFKTKNKWNGQNSKEVVDIDHVRTNSEEPASVLRLSSRWNTADSYCLVWEKDKLPYSKYGLTKN